MSNNTQNNNANITGVPAAAAAAPAAAAAAALVPADDGEVQVTVGPPAPPPGPVWELPDLPTRPTDDFQQTDELLLAWGMDRDNDHGNVTFLSEDGEFVSVVPYSLVATRIPTLSGAKKHSFKEAREGQGFKLPVGKQTVRIFVDILVCGCPKSNTRGVDGAELWMLAYVYDFAYLKAWLMQFGVHGASVFAAAHLACSVSVPEMADGLLQRCQEVAGLEVDALAVTDDNLRDLHLDTVSAVVDGCLAAQGRDMKAVQTKVFQIVERWARLRGHSIAQNARERTKTLLRKVHLQHVDVNFLTGTVQPSGFVHPGMAETFRVRVVSHVGTERMSDVVTPFTPVEDVRTWACTHFGLVTDRVVLHLNGRKMDPSKLLIQFAPIPSGMPLKCSLKPKLGIVGFALNSNAHGRQFLVDINARRNSTEQQRRDLMDHLSGRNSIFHLNHFGGWIEGPGILRLVKHMDTLFENAGKPDDGSGDFIVEIPLDQLQKIITKKYFELMSKAFSDNNKAVTFTSAFLWRTEPRAFQGNHMSVAFSTEPSARVMEVYLTSRMADCGGFPVVVTTDGVRELSRSFTSSHFIRSRGTVHGVTALVHTVRYTLVLRRD